MPEMQAQFLPFSYRSFPAKLYLALLSVPAQTITDFPLNNKDGLPAGQTVLFSDSIRQWNPYHPLCCVIPRRAESLIMFLPIILISSRSARSQ